MILPEQCPLSVFSMLGNKTLKRRAITIHKNKTNFYQEIAFKCFQLFTYQNATRHAKLSLWRKIILPKTFILSVFEHVTYKNA